MTCCFGLICLPLSQRDLSVTAVSAATRHGHPELRAHASTAVLSALYSIAETMYMFSRQSSTQMLPLSPGRSHSLLSVCTPHVTPQTKCMDVLLERAVCQQLAEAASTFRPAAKQASGRVCPVHFMHQA